MTSELHTRPLYMQIRDIIIDRINSGTWGGLEQIPNEYVLAQEFRVSIGTIRKAIEILREERLLTRQRGRGTFVIDRSSKEYENKFDRVRHLDGRQIIWQYQILKKDVGKPTTAEIDRLRLSGPNAEVLRLVRIRSADSRPVKYETISIALERMPGADRLVDTWHGMADLARATRILLGSCVEFVTISDAESPVTDGLGVQRGIPLLVLDRLVSSIDGSPLEWRYGYCLLTDKKYVSVLN